MAFHGTIEVTQEAGGGGAAVGAGPSALEESAGPKRGALKASGFGD